jgi:hypothetical protein
VILDVKKAVNSLLEEFLEYNRTQIKNKNDIYLILDIGWSYFGWRQKNVLL